MTTKMEFNGQGPRAWMRHTIGAIRGAGPCAISVPLVLFLASLTFSASAQLEVLPARRPGTSHPGGQAHARTHDSHTLQLPFWDDFSTTEGSYPDPERWIDSYHVWVNDGMAVNPPTINVATFDGLDSAGLAFNPNDVLVSGYTDVLTSRQIDLSAPAVATSERASVYLSFFYQWQGNGEPPDTGDFLELEFLDSTGTWHSVLSIYPAAAFDRTLFYDTAIAVSDGIFFHDAFQFRFRAFGRQSGPYDTWNLDYIFLNKNRTGSEESFPDVAAASELSTLFGQYSAVPYKHFLETQTIGPLTFDVKNLDNNNGLGRSVNYSVGATFVNYLSTDTTTSTETLVQSQGVDGSTGYMVPYRRTTVDVSTLPDPASTAQFDPQATAVDIRINAVVISKDDSVAAGQLARFSPHDLRVNDTISKQYRLANYYAYDDGVAEFAAGLIEAGSQLAYQFDLLVPQDTLIAFLIHFVPYGVTSNQTITFYIFDDDNGKPGNPLQTISSQRIERKKLNEFQTVVWIPAVLIDKPRFYIGWKQPVAGKALVGLDTDNNSGNRIFINTGGEWYQNDEVEGSLMIRPVFGHGEVDVTTGIGDEATFSLYPNPSRGSFYVDGKFDDIRIIDITGVRVPFRLERMQDRTYVEINESAGLYIVQCRIGDRVLTRKLIVSH